MRTMDEVKTAVAGKAIERGLSVEEQGDAIVVRYGSENQQAEDHLHRQAIRSIVERVDPEVQVRTAAINRGFKVLLEREAEQAPQSPEDEGEEAPTTEELIAQLRKLLTG